MIGTHTNPINFLKSRFICFAFSTVLLVVGVGAYFINGFKYSVDFTGGMEVLFRFSKDFSRDKLRVALRSAGWDDATLRDFSTKEEVLVRVPSPEGSQDLKGLAEKMRIAITNHFPSNHVEILEINNVGKGVGEELWQKSFWAMLIALLLMLVYISIRFKLAFALGAVVALLHDAIAILTVFLVLNREISPYVISALLATLGYSINDTIVIFTRIRENMTKLKGHTAFEIVNISITQVLRRTLLTSLSTALVVGSLFIFGGETLRGLSLALLIGIVFGTYSSVYIASPVMLWFQDRN